MRNTPRWYPRFLRCHGDSFERLAVALRRTRDLDRSPDAEEDEAWILRLDRGVATLVGGGRGVIDDVWLSPSGRVLTVGAFADSGPGLYAFDPDEGGTFRQRRLLAGLFRGVWGLHEGLVFAWGGTWREPTLWRGDGERWSELPCPRPLAAVHGLRDDLLIATGAGSIARWDGEAWRSMESPVTHMVGEVLVEDDESIWAVTHAGELLAGSVFGWSVLAALPDAAATPNGLARLGDQLLISAGAAGLYVADGDRITPWSPYIKPLQIFGARGRLVALERDWVAAWETPERRESLLLSDYVPRLLEG